MKMNSIVTTARGIVELLFKARETAMKMKGILMLEFFQIKSLRTMTSPRLILANLILMYLTQMPPVLILNSFSRCHLTVRSSTL